MFKEVGDLSLSDVLNAIVEQGEEYIISNHFSKSGKEWNSIKVNGELYAKQRATKRGDGLYFLCNEFVESKGLIK